MPVMDSSNKVIRGALESATFETRQNDVVAAKEKSQVNHKEQGRVSGRFTKDLCLP